MMFRRKTRAIKTEIVQLGRFGAVGLVATAVHLVVAHGVLAGAGGPVPAAALAWVGNLAGFICAFIVAVVGHHYLSFAAVGPFARSFGRYLVVALAGFAGNNLILTSLKLSGAISDAVSLSISIVAIPIMTWFASRFWAFKS